MAQIMEIVNCILLFISISNFCIIEYGNGVLNFCRTFYCKVFLFFRFGDRKCRFRDIAIRTYERMNFCPLESAFSAIATDETYDNSFGRLCPI